MSDPMMSQIMSKFAGKRKHQLWGKAASFQEPSSKRSKMTSPQHQFEDMITDEDEEYQSDTFSLPDTLDQRFEWTDGDANEGSESREDALQASTEPNVISIGWGGALSYNSKNSVDQSNLKDSASKTHGNILPWTIDTAGSRVVNKEEVPDYNIINTDGHEEDEKDQRNMDRTEFALSSAFIKLATTDSRSKRKEGRKRRKTAKSKGKRTPAAKAQVHDLTDEGDMDVLQDYIQNVGKEGFDPENHSFYASDIEDGSSFYISSDLESDSNGTQPDTGNRYPPSDVDSSDDLLFEGYNAWDIPDPEYQDSDSHKMFKKVINGSFDDIPPSLHNGLRARMRRQKNAGLSLKPIKPINYDNSAFSLSNNPHINLYQLDRSLHAFATTDDFMSVRIPSISKRSDECLTTTATFYGFTSEEVTSRSKSFVVLHKTESTRPPMDRTKLDEYISRAQAELLRDVDFSRSTKQKIDVRKMQDAKRIRQRSRASGKTTKLSKTSRASRARSDNGRSSSFIPAPSHGTVVGGEALPINTSNVGHRMLAAMGWKEGDSLGAKNTGIKDPIQAIIRRKRAGLGI